MTGSYPEPVAGLVIRDAYLWREEFLKGREEGAKDRPCAIILVVSDSDEGKRVVVLPLTHTPPSNPKDAIEIPRATKQRLGLDDDQSWIVLTEANGFIWPGPDRRPAVPRGDPTDVVFGSLPRALFNRMRDGFVENLRRKRASTTARVS